MLLAVSVMSSAETHDYSRQLYEQAVLGDGEAMFQLSKCYLNGNGVEKDYDKSDYWLERAAEKGQPKAVAAIKAMGGKTYLSDANRRQLAAEEKRERKRLEEERENNAAPVVL